MATMKRMEFVALMTKLKALYPNGISDESQWLASLASYWSMLKGYDADEIRCAFAVAWRRHPAWFPSCGQLVDIIDGASHSKAMDVWPDVLRLASRSSSDHADPVVRDAIRLMGGGARLGRMTTADLERYGRTEWQRAYEAAARCRQEAAARAALEAPRRLPAGRSDDTEGVDQDATTNGRQDERRRRTAPAGRLAACG